MSDTVKTVAPGIFFVVVEGNSDVAFQVAVAEVPCRGTRCFPGSGSWHNGIFQSHVTGPPSLGLVSHLLLKLAKYIWLFVTENINIKPLPKFNHC